MISGATIVKDVLRRTTTITIEVDEMVEMTCPRAPGSASFGDDWICLQETNITEELGYWQIEPEGTAMYLLRAAWYLAHKEQAGHPFDGNPEPMWKK